MLKPVKKLVLKPAKPKVPENLGPTERRFMSHKSENAMVAITVLAEDNPRAFDIVVDHIIYGDQVFHDFSTGLDDMNIRGEQIVIAHEFSCDQKVPLRDLVAIRSQEMVVHINKTWKRAPIEWAVVRGAHLHMHKKIVTPG